MSFWGLWLYIVLAFFYADGHRLCVVDGVSLSWFGGIEKKTVCRFGCVWMCIVLSFFGDGSARAYVSFGAFACTLFSVFVRVDETHTCATDGLTLVSSSS